MYTDTQFKSYLKREIWLLLIELGAIVFKENQQP